jgi:SPP1 gp7 family putative phage head morphogenesis protein
MDIAWSRGATVMNNQLAALDEPDMASTTSHITTATLREKAASFEADVPTIDLPLRFGNKDAAAFHRFKAFVSAIVTDVDLSDALKESLAQALENGTSIDQWRKEIDPIFDRMGYSRLNSYQTRTIWRTETTLAYGAGQFAKLQEVSDRFPYWEYMTAEDERVRPEHRILHGKIFKSTDKQYYPPIGFNCRCTAIPISRRQAEKRGIKKPDTVTPEMQAQISNAEFIGDKTKSFEDWLNERTRTLQRQSVQLIINKLAEIIAQLGADAST